MVTLYSKGTWIIMNSCVNSYMNYAFVHALLSHESSGTNASSIFFIYDFMNEQHLN